MSSGGVIPPEILTAEMRFLFLLGVELYVCWKDILHVPATSQDAGMYLHLHVNPLTM